MREIKILSKVKHPNIVKLIECIDSPKYVYLVLEFISGDSLHQNLKRAPLRQFSEDKAKTVIKQILLALDYLHMRNLSHRDVKLENVIVNSND